MTHTAPTTWSLLRAGIALCAAAALSPAAAARAQAPAPLEDGEWARFATSAAGLGCGPGYGVTGELALLRLRLRPAADENAPQAVPPLRPAFLAWVRDERPVPSALRNDLEAESYCEALHNARWTPNRVFEENARPGVTYAHLFLEPRKYRGEVVSIEGRLKRVRRFDAPQMLWQVNLRDVYEGWLFVDEYGHNPVCMVFTDLPPGLAVAERMEHSVRFSGYFFKKYRYKAGDSDGPNEWRDAPLLIGNSVTLLGPPPAPPPEEALWLYDLVPVFLGVVAVSLALSLGVGLWFRRGDRLVRQRVEAAARTGFVDPSEPHLRENGGNGHRYQRRSSEPEA